MGIWTNNGLNLAAVSGVQGGMTFVGISPGVGTLAAGLTNGTPTSQIVTNGTPPVALSIGQGLTITDGVNTQTCVVSGPTVTSGGQSTTPVTTFTPSNTFAVNVTAVAPTPLASDVALYGESQRAAVTGASAGSNPGESLIAGYFDGTQPTGIFVMVGFFGGAAATSTPGTGTLMGEDIVFWNHTQFNDTNMYQADATI